VREIVRFDPLVGKALTGKSDGERAFKSDSERGCGGFRCEPHSFAVSEKICKSGSGRGGDDGESRGGCFEQGIGETLGAGGEHEE